jgi:hypothetical protein
LKTLIFECREWAGQPRSDGERREGIDLAKGESVIAGLEMAGSGNYQPAAA